MNVRNKSSNGAQQAASTVAKEVSPLLTMSDELKAALACATEWLYPPADWRYLYHAMELIKQLVSLRVEMAGSDLAAMQTLKIAIDEIALNQEIVAFHYPRSIKGMGDNPSQGICWDHPLYSLFLVPTVDLCEQWIAMVATALPTMRALHEKSLAIPDTFGSRSYNVGKGLRQLAWADGVALSILVDLPIEAKSELDFLTVVRTIVELANIGPTSAGDFEQFYPLYRSLDWLSRGAPEWPKGEREGGGAGADKRQREKPVGGRRHVQFEPVFCDIDSDRDSSMSDVLTHVKGFSKFYSDVAPSERMQPQLDWALRNELPPKDFACDVHIDRTLANYHKIRRAQAVRAAHYGVQALTLAAQRLPVSNTLLSGFELEVLIKSLENTMADVWRDVPAAQRKLVAAYTGYRLAFSRPHQDAAQLVAVNGFDASQSNSWNWDSHEFQLKVQSPSHSYPQFADQTVPVRESFTLPAPALLKRLFSLLRTRSGRPFADGCERHLASLLAAINQEYGTEITANKMQNWVARRVEMLTGGDQVISTYFAGKAPADHMPAVYTTLAISTLQNAFQLAFWQLKEITGLDIAEPLQLIIPDTIDDSSPQVGTKHLVKTQVIRRTLLDLRTEIRLMYSTAGVGFAERHNIYTAYSLFIYFALTGARPLKHFLPMVEAIDLVEGLAFTSEKDNDQYSYSRLTVVCDVLINHLRQHSEHLRLLRSHLSLVNPAALGSIDAWIQASDLTSIAKPDRNVDFQRLVGVAHFFFFLDPKDGALIAPSAEILESYIGVEWKLRIYSLRHHFRTFLTRRSHQAESLDYAMGHMDSRMQPLGLYSTMPTSIWNRKLRQEMDRLCTDLGIDALSSPLQSNSVPVAL